MATLAVCFTHQRHHPFCAEYVRNAIGLADAIEITASHSSRQSESGYSSIGDAVIWRADDGVICAGQVVAHCAVQGVPITCVKYFDCTAFHSALSFMAADAWKNTASSKRMRCQYSDSSSNPDSQRCLAACAWLRVARHCANFLKRDWCSHTCQFTCEADEFCARSLNPTLSGEKSWTSPPPWNIEKKTRYCIKTHGTSKKTVAPYFF